MNASLSPYMLLKASRPSSPALYMTTYDLYSSAVQESSNVAIPEKISSSAAAAPVPSAGVAPVKTHYIADIKTRHNHAMKTTRMTACSSHDLASSSFHSPSR